LANSDCFSTQVDPEYGDVPAEPEHSQHVPARGKVRAGYGVCERVVAKAIEPIIELSSFIGRTNMPDEPYNVSVEFHLEAHVRISLLRTNDRRSNRNVLKVEPAYLQTELRTHVRATRLPFGFHGRGLGLFNYLK
jgi:hypothetical protein